MSDERNTFDSPGLPSSEDATQSAAAKAAGAWSSTGSSSGDAARDSDTSSGAADALASQNSENTAGADVVDGVLSPGSTATNSPTASDD